jgi:hypothetical protein
VLVVGGPMINLLLVLVLTLVSFPHCVFFGVIPFYFIFFFYLAAAPATTGAPQGEDMCEYILWFLSDDLLCQMELLVLHLWRRLRNHCKSWLMNFVI